MRRNKLFYLSICLVVAMASGYVQAANGEKQEKPVLTDSLVRFISGGESLKRKMDFLLSALKVEIATPFADDPSQCATVPVGALACGGPENYFVYSRKISNEKKVQDIASRYTKTELDWNRLSKEASTCSIIERPDTALVNGVCVVKDNHLFRDSPASK